MLNNLQFAMVRNARGRLPTLALLAGVFALGAVWGNAGLRVLPSARADVEEQTPTQHFLAGGERSEIVLKEIVGILRQDIVVPLKQMEARLARIEAIAEGKPAPPPVDVRRGMKGANR
jgi:hypothetical protein